MAFRTRRLYGLDDLDEIYQSGTRAAGNELAGVDDLASMPESSIEYTLEETEPQQDRPALGTIDPWEGRASTSLRIPGSLPGASFGQAGRFAVDDRRARRTFASPQMTGTRLAPVPERPIVDGDGIDEPERYQATQTVGARTSPLATTVRGAQPGTPLLGVDTAYHERQRREAAGLEGIDRPVGAKERANPYALTEEERARLDRAEHRDRNINIARTVFGGLSGLAQLGTAAAGNVGAATGIGQAMSGYEPMQDAVYQRVSGAIDRDRGQRVQAFEFEQAQAQQAAEAERAARMDESQLELRAAQTRRATTEAQQMQTEWDQLQGNRQAGVQWLRTLASHYQASREPLIAEIIAGTEPGGFLHNASMEQLNRYAQQLTAFATAGQIAGRAGVGARPGRPGAYTEVVNADGTVTRVPVPGSGGPARRAAVAAPAGAPRPAGTGPAPAPTPETAVIAEQALGAPLDAGENAVAEIFIESLRARGIDPSSPTGRQALRANIHTYRHAPSAQAQAAVINEARATITSAAEAQAGGLPANVDPASLRLMTAGGTNSPSAAFEAARATQSFIGRFRGYMAENRDALNIVLRSAGRQDGVVAEGVDAIANRMRQDLQRHINALLSKLAGANVTDNEMVRNLRALGTGSYSSNAEDFMSGLQDGLNELEGQFQARAAGVPPATVDYWLERATRQGGR